MIEEVFDNVLLVCDGQAESEKYLRRMVDNGVSVTGPARTGSIAMTLAAQTAPTVAIIARRPGGRRNAVELANDLYRTWGIRTWVMSGATEPGCDGTEIWQAPEAGIERLRRVLSEQEA